MLRLLPLPIFIGIYLFSYWRCKKNIAASDKQLKPCIDWAYLKNIPLPEKPSFIEFYIVYVSSFLISINICLLLLLVIADYTNLFLNIKNRKK